MAIVVPIMFLVFAGIVQFGMIFATQNALTQVARDIGRWAATQGRCDAPFETEMDGVIDKVNELAAGSALPGYPNDTFLDADVDVAWTTDVGACPPTTNADISWIKITIRHNPPIFFPWIPFIGEIAAGNEFRLEPQP